jgi:hypothetical protein
MVVIQGQKGWTQAILEELSVKAVVQMMWLTAKEASHSAQETMVVGHNPMGEEEELKLLDDAGTRAGDEVELTKQQEALALQNCNCTKAPQEKKNSKRELIMYVLITYLAAQNNIFCFFPTNQYEK